MEKLANTQYPVNEIIARRWSPRAYSEIIVDEKHVLSMLEAARWAPSGGNTQPWRFIYALKQHSNKFEKILAVLEPGNARWNIRAAGFIIVMAQKSNPDTGKPFNYGMFDCGLAVSNILIQAQSAHIFTHVMGGFNKSALIKAFNLNDNLDPLVIISFGYAGDSGLLEPDLLARELADRKRIALENLIVE